MSESSVTSLPKVNGSITNNDYFLLERSNVAYALTGEQLYKYVEDSAKHVEKGDKGDKGEKGDTYTLTDADRTEVAEKIILVDDDFRNPNAYTQMMIAPEPYKVQFLTPEDLFGIEEENLSTAVREKLNAGRLESGANVATNIRVSDTIVAAELWQQDNTYEDYPYRAAVPVTGVQAYMIPEIIFNVAAIQEGIFAPVASTYAGGVYLYASSKSENAITIPTMIFWG